MLQYVICQIFQVVYFHLRANSQIALDNFIKQRNLSEIVDFKLHEMLKHRIEQLSKANKINENQDNCKISKFNRFLNIQDYLFLLLISWVIATEENKNIKAVIDGCQDMINFAILCNGCFKKYLFIAVEQQKTSFDEKQQHFIAFDVLEYCLRYFHLLLSVAKLRLLAKIQKRKNMINDLFIHDIRVEIILKCEFL